MKHKLMRLPTALLLVALALGGSLSTAHAISVTPPTFTTLIEGSDRIVQGTVTDQESRWVTNNAGHRVIKTYLTIRVRETVKGGETDSLVLEFLGGSVGDHSMQIGGMPRFLKGDRGWFFVRGNGRYLCPLAYAHHGAYLLQTDPVDGTDRIVKLDGQPLAAASEIGDHTGDPTANRRLAAALSSADFGHAITREIAAIQSRQKDVR